MSQVVIRTYTLAPAAHLDAQVLRAVGIAASVQDEHSVSIDLLMPAVGYIKLMVPEEQAQRAQEILADLAKDGAAAVDAQAAASPGPDEDAEEADHGWACPRCGNRSYDVYHPYVLLAFTLILLPLALSKHAYCTRCRRSCPLDEIRHGAW